MRRVPTIEAMPGSLRTECLGDAREAPWDTVRGKGSREDGRRGTGEGRQGGKRRRSPRGGIRGAEWMEGGFAT